MHTSEGDGDGDEHCEEQHGGRRGEQWRRDTFIEMLKEDLKVSGPLSRRNLKEAGSRGRKQQSRRPRGRSPLGSQDTGRDLSAMPAQRRSRKHPSQGQVLAFTLTERMF